MELDCNNKLPSKNIQSTCLAYSDANIQEILDVGYFSEQFDFEAAAAAPESAPVSENTGSSGVPSVSIALGFASVMMLAILHL